MPPISMGYPRENMLGRTPYEILDNATADRIVERVKKVVKTGKSIREETSVHLERPDTLVY